MSGRGRRVEAGRVARNTRRLICLPGRGDAGPHPRGCRTHQRCLSPLSSCVGGCSVTASNRNTASDLRPHPGTSWVRRSVPPFAARAGTRRRDSECAPHDSRDGHMLPPAMSATIADAIVSFLTSGQEGEPSGSTRGRRADFRDLPRLHEQGRHCRMPGGSIPSLRGHRCGEHGRGAVSASWRQTARARTFAGSLRSRSWYDGGRTPARGRLPVLREVRLTCMRQD